MGKQLVWQERYNIGVEVIDREHKKLFSILNKLLGSKLQDKKSRWACQEGIKYFKEHAMKHFSEEEVYMASISYPGYETHRRVHDNFRKNTLPSLEKELNQTDYSEEAIEHFLGVCAGWLLGHTLTEDRAITEKTESRWRELLPEEEQAAMKQMMLHLMGDMFQLDARVVSECYGGERFGKGIYYRLVYSASKEEAWEIVLVFEEKLLSNTVGRMLGAQSEEMSVMVMNVVRYTARQFVERLRSQFLPSDTYEITEENLLSFEQFDERFHGRKPQSSFLFDTGEGYFAFCAFAPHLVQEGKGISIKNAAAIQAENAMSEVEKYLNQNHKAQERLEKRKKILVVDDSDLMRQAMKELLEEDYEIAGANSGLAAIRCIALERPDLVLLDYEMPVCDGRQVLEMIRSEKDFTDIPVMFLTGRVDRESVQKAISLKPAGYLLKTLAPEKIKKEIDGYFRKKGR